MEDLKKIQEFFSKPLEENQPQFKVGDKVTYLGHPAEITAVNKEMTGAITYNVAYNKGYGRTKATNLFNKGGEIKPLEENKEENDLFKINPELSFKIFSFLKTKLGEKFTSEFPIKSNFHFQLNDYLKEMNEAMTTTYKTKEEDPVDTITMDIPLFLRMLEYSREDANEDMDLHDVTEKANLLGKERGILQMDDYDEIVGAAKDTPKGEMKEMDYGSILMRNLMPGADVLEKYANTLIMDPKIASASTEQEFRGLLRDKIEKAQWFGKDEVSKAAEYVLSSDNNASKYSNTITRVFNMVKGKSVNETVNLKASKLSSAEYQKAKKLKDFKASDWKWNSKENLYTKVNEVELSEVNLKKGDIVNFTNGKKFSIIGTKGDGYEFTTDDNQRSFQLKKWFDMMVSSGKATVNEETLSEAYVPSNIKEFAKRKGVSSLVNKVAGWAEKVGKGIRGGTAIGKNYSTLILDMGYQTADIYINIEDETIELYGEEVNSFPEFQRVYLDNKEEGNSLEERIAEAFNKINENKGSITGPEWDKMDIKSRIKLLRYHFPELSLKFADWKWKDLTPMIKNKLTGKSVKENTDYIKRRQSQNDYAINKKDKPSKSTNPKYSGKTDYMKRRQKELTEIIFNKLKK